jgi:hypothetical protein
MQGYAKKHAYLNELDVFVLRSSGELLLYTLIKDLKISNHG